MLSKEVFCDVIEKIQKQDIIDESVSRSLELVCDSWVLFNSKNNKYDALNIVFKEAMEDKYDLISWWLYEDVDKFIYIEEDTYYDLTKVDSLYYYLTDIKKLKTKRRKKKKGDKK